MKSLVLILSVCAICLAGCEEKKKPVVTTNYYGCGVTYQNKSVCKKVCETKYYRISADTMSEARAQALAYYLIDYPDSNPKVNSCWDCDTKNLDDKARETCRP
jgi:hypothetical protein